MNTAGLMQGKKGLVVGIANDRSYATFITESLLKAGAQCAFTHLPGEKMERRCRNALQELGVQDPWLMPMDAGSDADLVVFDPEYRGTISAANQMSAVDHNVFEGWEIHGRAAVVTVRGEVAARDGKFIGVRGRGKLLDSRRS